MRAVSPRGQNPDFASLHPGYAPSLHRIRPTSHLVARITSSTASVTS